MIKNDEERLIRDIKYGRIRIKDIDESRLTERVCLEAVKKDYRALAEIHEQTDKICLAAIKNNASALKSVKNKTKEIVYAAVKKNGLALQYVNEYDEDLCLTAVRSNGEALMLIDEQTEFLCREGVKNNGKALRHVKNQTDDICMTAVKQNGIALAYVERQTNEICLAAINEFPEAFIYVDSDVFEFWPGRIIDIYEKNSSRPTRQKAALEKIAEILNRLDDEKLIKAVEDDLRTLFTKENLTICDALLAIKTKVRMLLEVKKNKDNNNNECAVKQRLI